MDEYETAEVWEKIMKDVVMRRVLPVPRKIAERATDLRGSRLGVVKQQGKVRVVHMTAQGKQGRES